MRKLSSATGSGSSIVGYSLVVAGLLFGDLVVFGAGKPARPDLEKYLQRIGYEPILLERDEDNHLTVRALLDGRKRNFMVDTGWAMTTVSKATVRRLKTLGELGVKLEDSFLGTLSDSSMVLMEKLTLGPADFLNQPAEAMKLNMEGRSFGHDGVLGCDFLVRNQCLIDCLDKRLYVRGDKAPVEVLAALKK